MKIDGVEIDEQLLSGEFRRLMQSQADRPEELKVPEDEVKRIVAENVAARVLLVNESRRLYPEIPEKEIQRKRKELAAQYGTAASLDPFLPQMMDDIRIERLIHEIHRRVPSPTEAEARERYKADPTAWAEPEKVHCSHIVRHTFGGADPNKALMQIMEAQKLVKAGHPFADVGRRFSDRFGQSGDLGTFPRGNMVDSFDDVVFRMKPGEVSDVFRTEFGYHLVLLHEKVPARERSYAEARKDVMSIILNERRQRAVEELAAGLRSAAEITYDW